MTQLEEELATTELPSQALSGLITSRLLADAQTELDRLEKLTREQPATMAASKRERALQRVAALREHVVQLRQHAAREEAKASVAHTEPTPSPLYDSLPSRFVVLDPWPRGSRHFASRVAAARGCEVAVESGDWRPWAPSSAQQLPERKKAADGRRSFVVLGGARGSDDIVVRRVELVECRPSDYPAVREQPLPMLMNVLPRVPRLQQHHPDHPSTLLYATADARLRLPASYPKPIVSNDLNLTFKLSPTTTRDTKVALRSMREAGR